MRKLLSHVASAVLVSGVVVILAVAPVDAAGFASNENFTVFTPAVPSQEEAQTFAEELLAKAEEYRKEIALQWLSQEIPPGIGRTTINVVFRESEETALTWAKDDPRRRYHTIYLSTSPQRALGSALAHEIAHVVLATRYPAPDRLSAWIEEGIASKYDDASRKATRDSIIAWVVRTGDWPRLRLILDTNNINSKDQVSYATAASLTNYLLSLESKSTLLEFARSAAETGWDAALSQYYGIAGVSGLQEAWQRWVPSAAGHR